MAERFHMSPDAILQAADQHELTIAKCCSNRGLGDYWTCSSPRTGDTWGATASEAVVRWLSYYGAPRESGEP